MSTVAVFASGVVAGIAVLIFLGGGRDRSTAPAARASEERAAQTGQKEAPQKEVPQVGRYQAITFVREPGSLGPPGGYAGLLDTATGKVWTLHDVRTSPITWKWDVVAEGPK